MAKNKFSQTTGEVVSPETNVTTPEVVDTLQTQGEVTDQIDTPVDSETIVDTEGVKEDTDAPVQVEGGLTEDQSADEEEPVAELDVAVEVQRVNALINDTTLTPESKLDQVAVSPFLAISIVGGRLKDYKEDMHRNNGQLELKQGANRNNQLYKTIMSVLKQEDDEIFKAGFNLINIIFKSFATEDEAFNHYSLTRYDAGWDNQKDLSTYNKLCVVITTLADAKTREELKTTIDFNKLRDRDKTNFTDAIVNRLVSYYGI